VSFFSTLLLALGLAADATAVSATLGLSRAHVQLRHIVAVMAWFGLFQGGMALLGSLLGEAFGAYLAAWDHWIAFGLLSGLGGKMLWEARSTEHEQTSRAAASFGFVPMLLLAIATSIDAFAVGVTLPLLHGDVPQACLIIGVVTALMSALGLLAGRKFGDRLGRGADAAGGALLIVIGLKILFEHLSPT
jgi:putative Mn2+ efflux pump MntP